MYIGERQFFSPTVVKGISQSGSQGHRIVQPELAAERPPHVWKEDEVVCGTGRT